MSRPIKQLQKRNFVKKYLIYKGILDDYAIVCDSSSSSSDCSDYSLNTFLLTH